MSSKTLSNYSGHTAQTMVAPIKGRICGSLSEAETLTIHPENASPIRGFQKTKPEKMDAHTAKVTPTLSTTTPSQRKNIVTGWRRAAGSRLLNKALKPKIGPIREISPAPNITRSDASATKRQNRELLESCTTSNWNSRSSPTALK